MITQTKAEHGNLSSIPPIIKTVLFVCTGNICRSPAAERVFQNAISDLADFRVHSAGTHAREGNQATESMIIACREEDFDLTGHRAKKLTPEMIREAEIVLTMERLHTEYVLSLDLESLEKTFNLAWFAGYPLYTDSIPDPYGCSLREYRRCLSIISQCVTNLCERITDRFVRKEDRSL
ncbi:MAG: hypothetical protein V1736_02205 [Pseudomonadota bacterium]